MEHFSLHFPEVEESSLIYDANIRHKWGLWPKIGWPEIYILEAPIELAGPGMECN